MALGGAGNLAGRFVINMATRWGSSQLGCRLVAVGRLIQPYMAYQQIDTITANMEQARLAMERGDYEGAASLIGNSAGLLPATMRGVRETMRFANAARTLDPQTIRNYLQACFAAGTPILWEFGHKNVEQFRVGDRVWSRDENDPAGALELKEIEETFVHYAPIWHLHLGGEVMRTTDEHPLWVVGKGWTKASELRIDDLLVSHDGQTTRVDDILDTGVWETVYNFRVADHHTYFVGGADWDFAVWAHNAECTRLVRHREGNQQVDVNGQRWNLPANRQASQIPQADPVGDQLQTATTAAAARWNRSFLTVRERQAIQDAVNTNRAWEARLLEAQARGRWIESQVRDDAAIRALGLRWGSNRSRCQRPEQSRHCVRHYVGNSV